MENHTASGLRAVARRIGLTAESRSSRERNGVKFSSPSAVRITSDDPFVHHVGDGGSVLGRLSLSEVEPRGGHDEVVEGSHSLERGLHDCLVTDVQHDPVECGQVRPFLGRDTAAAGDRDGRAHGVGGVGYPEADRLLASDDDALAGEIERRCRRMCLFGGGNAITDALSFAWIQRAR